MTNQVTLRQIIGKDGIFIDGDWVESKDQNPNGSVRLIQLADIGDGKFINKSKRYLTPEKASELKCTFLKPGDVLIARMPDPIGRSCIFPQLDTPCVTVVDVCIVRPDIEIVLPEWLMYQINSQQFRRKIQKYITGTTRQRISRGNLEKIKFNVPSLDKQKSIVKILNQSDNLRRKRKQALEYLDKYIESVFVEIFGDPVNNPNGWQFTTLEKITKKITDGTHQSPKFVDNGIPFIFISNITNNEISLNTKKFISETTYKELTKATSIEKGDILYTTVGSYGNPAIVRDSKNFCFQRHIAHIKPDIQKTNIYFLYGLLKSSFIKRQADEKVRGVAQKTLNLFELKNFKVFLPPIEIQNKFADAVIKTKLLKQKMLLQSQELDTQFQALMQKSFQTTII